MRFRLTVDTKVGDEFVPVMEAQFETTPDEAKKLVSAFNLGIYNAAVRIAVSEIDPDPPVPRSESQVPGAFFQC